MKPQVGSSTQEDHQLSWEHQVSTFQKVCKFPRCALLPWKQLFASHHVCLLLPWIWVRKNIHHGSPFSPTAHNHPNRSTELPSSLVGCCLCLLAAKICRIYCLLQQRDLRKIRHVVHLLHLPLPSLILPLFLPFSPFLWQPLHLVLFQGVHVLVIVLLFFIESCNFFLLLPM